MMTIDEALLAHIAYNLRRLSLTATTHAGSGHVTSCFSAADIMAVLFFHCMHFDPHNPDNSCNDRFILSKGHTAPLLYAVWKELGILNEEELLKLRTFNSPLEGHPTPRFSRSEAATGSLGQGLSIANGIALAARMDGDDFYTYTLLGDMELTEGSVWEAAELASFYTLKKLIAIVDCNGLGQSTETFSGHDVLPYQKKFEAFGWNTLIVDGHNITHLIEVFKKAKDMPQKPTVILAKTIKGFGLASIEDKQGFHGKAFSKNDLPMLLNELAQRFEKAATYKPIEKIVISFKPCEKRLSNSKQLNFKDLLPEPNSPIATRKAYGQALVVAGNVCQEIVSLDAEVKNSTYADLFEKQHPERFFQCFIAEQNMVSMGVGFTNRKKIPFISTFGAFFTRAYDQIRMAAIGRASLRLIGSHAGVAIGQDGPSQMALEDIAIMRCLPDSVVLYPADARSTYALVECMANYHDGISYLRTTRQDTPVLYEKNEQFMIGGCKVLRNYQRNAACIAAAGITLFEALKAYEELKQEGIFIAVIDLYSIKPLDYKTIRDIAYQSNNHIITVEDHYLEGGLGQAVAYALRNEAITIECLAVSKIPRSGTPQELLAYEEIDAAAIKKAVKKCVQ